MFNGAASASGEPFEVHQTEFDRHGRSIIRSFCKTDHAPYDVCVQLALIVLKQHLGRAIVVVSDGNDSDWLSARETCEKVLGFGGDFKLSARE